MPTIYKAGKDGDHIRFVHHSLVVFYLEQANNNALNAKVNQVQGVMLATSVISILFSAIALEAFLNEIAENILDEAELEDISYARGSFKNMKGQSSIRSKFSHLLKIKYEAMLDDGLGNSLDELSELRNALVHYKLGKYATKLKVLARKPPEGMMVVDFSAPTEVLEQPLVEKITAHAAVNGFNSALEVINFIGKLDGYENNTPGFEPIT